MKKALKSILFSFFILFFLIGVAVATTERLYAGNVIVLAGKSFSTSVKPTYANSSITLDINSFSSTSYAKKTLLTIGVKNSLGTYDAAVAETKNLTLACYTYFYEDIGGKDWKLTLKQGNVSKTTSYAGINADVTFGSYN